MFAWLLYKLYIVMYINISFRVNTIVFPLKSMIGSSSFPVEYAKVQSAYADLSSQPVKSLYRPNKQLTIISINPEVH